MRKLPLAVILAAGRGRRLGGMTRSLPKTLVEVGGRPLIAHMLDRLDAAGLREVLIITGHAGRRLRLRLGHRHGRLSLRYGVNAEFRSGGSMISLLRAIERCGDRPFLLLESDILFDARFIGAALAAGGSALLAAPLSGSGDEVYVVSGADATLAALGKALPAALRARAVGEFAGICRLEPGLLSAFTDLARRWVAAGDRNRHYEDVLAALAAGGLPLPVLARPGLRWGEVDTAHDLRRARCRPIPAMPKRPLRPARA